MKKLKVLTFFPPLFRFESIKLDYLLHLIFFLWLIFKDPTYSCQILLFQPKLLVTLGHFHHSYMRIGVLTSKSIIVCHETRSYWVLSPPVPLVKDSPCLFGHSSVWDKRTLQQDSSRVLTISLCYFLWGFSFQPLPWVPAWGDWCRTLSPRLPEAHNAVSFITVPVRLLQ